MGFRVGVDIGGTFTDFCVFDESTGALSTLKVLSRPDKPGAEIMTGLTKIAESSLPPDTWVKELQPKNVLLILPKEPRKYSKCQDMPKNFTITCQRAIIL